jgi:hypothetical protein
LIIRLPKGVLPNPHEDSLERLFELIQNRWVF